MEEGSTLALKRVTSETNGTGFSLSSPVARDEGYFAYGGLEMELVRKPFALTPAVTDDHPASRMCCVRSAPRGTTPACRARDGGSAQMLEDGAAVAHMQAERGTIRRTHASWVAEVQGYEPW
jgi:hypothetical protein